MVFSNLHASDKAAFFSLLDEYFESRPDLAASLTGSRTSSATTSVVRNAIANNSETASKVISSGFKRGVSQTHSPNASNASGSDDVPATMGRVAAASLALSQIQRQQNNSYQSPSLTSSPNLHKPGPPAPPGRVSSGAGSNNTADKAKSLGLTGKKKIGGLETTSGAAFFGSLRTASGAKAIPPPTDVRTAPAFPARKNTFAPPPQRATVTPAEPEPEPEIEPEPETADGEWAVALYDYESNEVNDLPVKEGQDVWVIERTSGDWWTGEVNGRRGLFPASYVRIA